ncbi:MAG: DbpA RNA binding domain-containing protein, partial [Myxococcales bacterium]|nr:DbpA RNA binding domain-containing protein [Myxococcales bacterium]
VHRIGRTGRAGRGGRAVTLATPKERDKIRRLEHVLKVHLEQRPVPSDADLERMRRRALTDLLAGTDEGEGGAEAFLEEVVGELGLTERELLVRAVRALAAERRIDLDARPDETAPKWTRRAEATPAVDEAQIFLPMGKRNGVRPQDIVGALANDRGVPGTEVGRIFIADRKTIVGLPEAVVQRLVGSTVELRGHQVPISRVRADLFRPAGGPSKKPPHRGKPRPGKSR